MLKIENYEVVGWEHAIRGMRNPKNSWDKSDSTASTQAVEEGWFDIGPNDHNLMSSLAKGGPVHAKYRRMITVYLDITAPLYWWKEFDTYKVGTVANSCSTMHKIHAKEFELGDFSYEHLNDDMDACRDGLKYMTSLDILKTTIEALNYWREYYLNMTAQNVPGVAKKAKEIWWQMIQLLPASYNQKRTVMLNYEVLHNIYFFRKDHKLDEWHTLCDWIKTLPYSELITMEVTE